MRHRLASTKRWLSKLKSRKVPSLFLPLRFFYLRLQWWKKGRWRSESQDPERQDPSRLRNHTKLGPKSWGCRSVARALPSTSRLSAK